MSKGLVFFLLWYNVITSLTYPAKLYPAQAFLSVAITSTTPVHVKAMPKCHSASMLCQLKFQSPERKRYNYILVGSSFLKPITPYQKMIAAKNITKRTAL